MKLSLEGKITRLELSYSDVDQLQADLEKVRGTSESYGLSSPNVYADGTLVPEAWLLITIEPDV